MPIERVLMYQQEKIKNTAKDTRPRRSGKTQNGKTGDQNLIPFSFASF